MGVQFKVDLTRLQEMASRLVSLKSEFESISDRVDGYETATGPDVADALGSFAGNWSDKRKEIAELIEQVATSAEQAATGYQTTETAVSDGFSEGPSGG